MGTLSSFAEWRKVTAVAQDNHTDRPETWEEGPSAKGKTQAGGLVLGAYSPSICGEAGRRRLAQRLQELGHRDQIQARPFVSRTPLWQVVYRSDDSVSSLVKWE